MSRPAAAPETHEAGPDLERVIVFSDGLFAIAITLLTLEIKIPEGISPADLPQAISSLGPKILVFVISYLVVGVYWVGHHRSMRLLRRYNYRFVWLNLLFLMFIAFNPVATNLLGNYGDQPAAVRFYAVTITLTGLAQFALWQYMVSNYRLIDVGLSQRFIQYKSLRLLVGPFVFLLAVPLASVNTTLAEFSWLLIVPLMFILNRIYGPEVASM